MKRTILTLFSMVLLAAIAVPAISVAAGAKIDVTVVMHNARTEEIVCGIANRIKNDATEAQVPAFIAGTVQQIYNAARAAGHGALDQTVVAQEMEKLAHVELGKLTPDV